MENNITNATTTDMKSNVPNFEYPTYTIDAATGQKETEYINPYVSKYFGFYKKNHNFKKAIDALATWTVGKGFTTDVEASVILDHITGWGEDTFNSIAWNMFVTKKVCGDAFAEIVRDEKTGTLINLKPLNPANIKIIVNDKGQIIRYEQVNKVGSDNKVVLKFEPKQILHLCNDRVADEIHGTSVAEVCETIIQTIGEIQTDYRIAIHRNVFPVRVIYVDTDNETEISKMKTKYENLIKSGEVMIAPKNSVEIKTDTTGANAILNPMPYLQYLDNLFYRAVGVPKIVIGGSEEFTEATAKIAYLTFEQVYTREQIEFEADVWNQIGIKITLNKPASLQNELLSDNAKDVQTGMTKPSEMTPSMQQE